MLLAETHKRLVDAQNADRQTTYTCPACHERVRLHRGSQVSPYFAHLPRTACQSFSEGETAEHVAGKRQLAAFFRPWGPTTLERSLPRIGQRADVWVARDGGAQPVAVELQCSPLARDRVAARTAGYQRLGVYPLWLLGRRYAQQKLNWSLIDRFACWLPQWGLCLLFWDARRQGLRIRHHLQQDAAGRYTGWAVTVTSLAAFLAGEIPRIGQGGLDLRRLRRQWAKDLLHGAAYLRPIQEQLYYTHHHLAGFPLALATTRLTAPVFGQGLLLWRIVLGAWLFAAGPSVTPPQLAALGRRAFNLVGGHRRGVRFTADRAVQAAQVSLLTDLVAGGYLQVTATGWVVLRQPTWAADYGSWLKNNEKIRV